MDSRSQLKRRLLPHKLWVKTYKNVGFVVPMACSCSPFAPLLYSACSASEALAEPAVAVQHEPRVVFGAKLSDA